MKIEINENRVFAKLENGDMAYMGRIDFDSFKKVWEEIRDKVNNSSNDEVEQQDLFPFFKTDKGVYYCYNDVRGNNQHSELFLNIADAHTDYCERLNRLYDQLWDLQEVNGDLTYQIEQLRKENEELRLQIEKLNPVVKKDKYGGTFGDGITDYL